MAEQPIHTARLSREELLHNPATCRFEAKSPERVIAESETSRAPLSVILQVTRRCNFNCVFCSETRPMPDPTLSDLEIMRKNLSGVRRIFLSGGEPLLRSDLPAIAEMFGGDFILGLPTNGSLTGRVVPDLLRNISFVNIGFEGPRNITNRVRGDYEAILSGIRRFQELGASLSLCCVVLGSTVESVPFTCQMGDLLGVNKVKLVLPIRKGNAVELPREDYLSLKDTRTLYVRLRDLKDEYGWTPRFAMTPWTEETEGYSMLVQPNGDTFAWPVYDESNEMLMPLGNLLTEHVEDIWNRNPYKQNHLKKYLGTSIYVW